MTVAELIKQLQGVDQDMEVCVRARTNPRDPILPGDLYEVVSAAILYDDTGEPAPFTPDLFVIYMK